MYNMTIDSKLVFIIIISNLFFLTAGVIGYVSGQTGATTTTVQKVEEVQEQVQSNSIQTDAALAGIGVTGAGLAATFLNSFIKGRKLAESDKRTDRDTMMSFLYIYRLIQTMDALIPEVSKCLDQPFNSDPMQKHQTIRMKLADDANQSAQYLMTHLNTAPPSMTPSAAVIVADAQTATPVQPKPVAQTAAPANNVANTTSKPGVGT